MRRFSPIPRFRYLLFALVLWCAGAGTGAGVIHLDTGDPTLYASTPGDNSGWQFEGFFGTFLGTPIAPRYFITAKHIGQPSPSFVFHGETFTIVGNAIGDPLTDLQIWQVDHDFATYAPLYQPGTVANSEVGQELRVHGTGTQRGDPLYNAHNKLLGWAWGMWDGVERWGRNLVTSVVANDDAGNWTLLQSAFDSPGLAGEAHLAVGDSGGGVFILQDGLWRLAGVNYAVDTVFTQPNTNSPLNAALFDARGYYEENADGSFTQITGKVNVPTSFYSTQISHRISWIGGVIGAGNVNSLPAESFAQWSHAYFTPAQLSDATVSGPNADPDGDGVTNLLEFAFNLEPTHAESVTMTAGSGLRGLPLIRLEIVGTETRLTIEFVRRTAKSGAGLTYAVQFASGLNAAGGGWQTGGTESVTAINARWERVKVTDSVPVDANVSARFARVLVTPNASPSLAGQKSR